MQRNPLARACALAMVLGAAPALAAPVYFFGDSLTDTGAFQGLANGSATLATGTRWTYDNAPFYADVLARALGGAAVANNPLNPATSSQGNNYAQGGARSSVQSSNTGPWSTAGAGGFPPADPRSAGNLAVQDLPDQVGFYLSARNGRADSAAWHVLWSGGNDIPAALETSAVSGSTAGVAQVSSDASSLLGQVQRLRVAGAERFIVPNLPAFGLTPATVSSTVLAVINAQPTLAAIPSSTKLAAIGAAQQVLSSAATPDAASQQALRRKALNAAESVLGLPANTLVNQYEGSNGVQSSVNSLATLFNGTVNLGLSQTGVNLVRLDVAGLLNEIIADPLRYGFDNVTGSACPAGVSSLACFSSTPGFNANLRYLFADDRHPSPQAQQMIGDYAVATLAAPYYAAALPAAAESASAGLYNTLEQRHRLARQAPQTVGTVSAFAQYGYQPFAAKGAGGLDGGGQQHAYTVGVEAQLRAETRLGLALGYQQGTLDSGANSDFRFRQQRLAAYASQQWGEFSLAADAFIASNAYRSVRRSFALGAVSRSESGETDGEQTGLRVSGRYHWQYGDWTLSPMLGLAYENIRVNGYGETGDNSTAMRFGSQKQAGWQARLGVDVATRLGRWLPYASAEWVQRLSTRQATLDAAIKSQPGQFSTELARPERSWGQLRLGSQVELVKGLMGNIEAYSSVARNSGRQWGVQLGVSHDF